MKNKILFLTILVSVTGTMLFSCQSSVENAKENVKDAQGEVVITKQQLDMAINDSIELYRKNAMETMLAIEERIAELKAEAETRKEYKVKYEKIMAGLEQKNKEMKKRLNDYKDEGAEMWNSFKEEFEYDTEELEKALSNLFVDNK